MRKQQHAEREKEGRTRKGKTERDRAELQKEMGEEREREPQAIWSLVVINGIIIILLFIEGSHV